MTCMNSTRAFHHSGQYGTSYVHTHTRTHISIHAHTSIYVHTFIHAHTKSFPYFQDANTPPLLSLKMK